MIKYRNCGKALREYPDGYDRDGKGRYVLLHVNNSENCKVPEPTEGDE